MAGRFGKIVVTGLLFVAIPTTLLTKITTQTTTDTLLVAGAGVAVWVMWNAVGIIKDALLYDDSNDYDGLYVMDEDEYTDALINTAKTVAYSAKEHYGNRERVIRDYYEDKLDRTSEPKSVTTNNTYTYYNTSNNTSNNAYVSSHKEEIEYIDTKLIKG